LYSTFIRRLSSKNNKKHVLLWKAVQADHTTAVSSLLTLFSQTYQTWSKAPQFSHLKPPNPYEQRDDLAVKPELIQGTVLLFFLLLLLQITELLIIFFR